MKIIEHKADSRGFANHGWLQANHSFSFAGFQNPEKVHFGALRVLNDDIIAPKMGFGTHPHDNMEIITIPLKGVLKHKDNMSDEWIPVLPGEVQVMSAGTGVQHSEINGSVDEHLSLFQIYTDPLILYIYTASITFFSALYQAFKLLTYISQNKVFTSKAVKTLQKIKYCGIILCVLIFFVGVYIKIFHSKEDDPAGFISLCILTTFLSVVVASITSVFEKKWRFYINSASW